VIFWEAIPALAAHDWLQAAAWMLVLIYLDQPSSSQFWEKD